MFDPSETPRLIGVPPGADFPQVLVSKVLAAHQDRPPEDLARVRILVNTRRMERRLHRLFRDGKARLLPTIGLVTDVERVMPGMDLPPPVSRLRRKLELAQLTTRLIEAEPDLAARSAAVDLADSLASLLDEMQGEGLNPDRLDDLDVGDASLHWERSLKFLNIAKGYVAQVQVTGLDEEARRRLAVSQLCGIWERDPPKTPVILAGSTGSRSTTRMLMAAVARLPQGALVLPGFDFDLPDSVWHSLSKSRDTEDHPQYRFAALLRLLHIGHQAVTAWGEAPDRHRNRLVSLSLRPARITDQWLSEGPLLGDLRGAVKAISLIEAPEAKDEARAIAVAIREAVEDGKKVALITPDRTLTRRVSATLGRWNIVPDDSAGVPLSLTPAGRLLRQVAQAVGKPAAPDKVIALLKHPLVCRVDGGRGPHLRLTRGFETFLRDSSCFVITDHALDKFAEEASAETRQWVDWLREMLAALSAFPEETLDAAISHHIDLCECLAKGFAAGPGTLWEGSDGEACKAQLDLFRLERDFSGPLSFADYTRLIEAALNAESDRVPILARPDVMIWGTLEARVQGADLVILSGLNEGVWPEPGLPDPWLNRAMRHELGLLLPEGQVGLAAHDYQQAIAAPEVILSRAKRGGDGEAVPSRWLNRLTNLLSGLPEQHGPAALADMQARGIRLLADAALLDRPRNQIAPEKRPAPAPPSKKRPKSYTVTEIAKLIRDPYAIYARHVLRLQPLMPLVPQPDARLKGIVFHEIVKAFFDPATGFDAPSAARDRLFQIAEDCLRRAVPWPAVRNHWLGHLTQIADPLIEGEQARRRLGRRIAAEVKGKAPVGAGFEIRGTADRIDLLTTGRLVIYDYKTGTVPSDKQVKTYDRQLLIEAVMAEAGGFEGLEPAPVERVAYLHLGRSVKDRDIALENGFETVTVSGELAQLLASFDQPTVGYISRRAMEKMRYEGDYDHLARFGEWDASARTEPEPLP